MSHSSSRLSRVWLSHRTRRWTDDASYGRVIRLAIAILKGHRQPPAADPVVLLRGGPGESPLKMVNTTQRMIWILFPIVIALFSAGLFVFALFAWKDRYWNLAARIHYSGVTLSAMIFAGWLIYWIIR